MAYRKKNKPIKAKVSSLAHEAYKMKADAIELEEEPTIDAESLQDCVILLYGVPKIGKTRFFCNIEGMYLLPTEPGYHFQNVRKTPIRNWITFKTFVKKMEKRGKFVRTVRIWGIDTVDKLAKFCMQYVCGREGITHPSDQEWGKGWEAYRDEFTHWILRLGMLGPGLGFISHESSKEVIVGGLKVPKAIPELDKTTYKVINPMADLILRMGFVKVKTPSGRKKKRCLFTRPTAYMDAGDRTGVLPDKIKFATEKEAIKTMQRCFEKGG